MAAGTLYTYPENWRAFKALIAAQYSGAQVRVLSAPPHFHFGQTNRTPEFLRKFPAGKVPAFEGDDGFCVFESNAIAYYVSFADSDIVPPASTWVFPTLGIMHYNKQATETAKEDMRRILGLLDAHLKTRTFLVGERVTLADITVVCTLFRNVPAVGQAEEERLCQCHPLWNQQQQLHFWSLGLPRPGARLSAESRLAGGLRVIHVAEVGSRQRGDPDAGARVLLLGGGLPARGQSLQSGQDLQVNIALAELPAPALPALGVIKGN
uniref:Eukaryotic translation elongation factor 1 gamma n=1 Tax=Myotis myotis TaxID=51298 RepID=A0A7J7RGS1_MYOMY|nr:eukaryotic translation elongation factor 1 gamma [Myotis myotis]